MTEAAAVPAHAQLVRAFANTVDVDDGTDLISTPAGLLTWLRGHDLVEAPVRASAADVRVAADLRAGLRELMARHHDSLPPPPDNSPDNSPDALARALSGLRLRLDLSGGRPRLVPADRGVRGALERVLAAVADGRDDGSWERLKICPADTCRVAFYDNSRNRSRTWCSMAVCGNRTKTRAYRARSRRPGHDS